MKRVSALELDGRALTLHLTAMMALSIMLAGCVSSDPIKIESSSVAKRLGLKNCRISIPMSSGEAVEIGKKWHLYPDPETDQEWAKMAAMHQAGDELRLVSCSVGDPYFHALVRGDVVIYKYRLPVLD